MYWKTVCVYGFYTTKWCIFRIHFYYMFGLLWTGWLAYTAGRTYLFGDEASEHLVWMLYSLVPVKRSLTTGVH